MATPFFTTTITCGAASIATSTQALTAGEEVEFIGGGGVTSLSPCSGVLPGKVYYVNSTGLSSTTVQICAQPSCSTGSIVPGGTGSVTPIGQGLYSGTSGTFVMSANATGTSAGNDTVKVGEIIIAGGCTGTGANTCFVSYGGSAPHFVSFHAFQASGATPYGPCWQVDVSAFMAIGTDQCDNQVAVQDGVNLRFGSDVVEGFFTNLGTSYYVGTRGVRIDPSINTNPGQITVLGTIQQGYGAAQPAELFQDNSSGHNNLCIESAAPFTLCGTVNPALANDDGIVFQANDPGGTIANYWEVVASIEGPLAANVGALKYVCSACTAQNDLNAKLLLPNAAASSGLHGGDLTLIPGAGDGAGRAGVFAFNGSIVSGGTPSVAGTGGCATFGTVFGGAQSGHSTCTGTAGAATITLTMPNSGGTGWSCFGGDVTAGTSFAQKSTLNNTTCVLSGTIATTGDEVSWGGIGH
jgi:hypothetical protein